MPRPSAKKFSESLNAKKGVYLDKGISSRDDVAPPLVAGIQPANRFVANERTIAGARPLRSQMKSSLPPLASFSALATTSIETADKKTRARAQWRRKSRAVNLNPPVAPARARYVRHVVLYYSYFNYFYDFHPCAQAFRIP